jgi:hypothetical protein
MILSGQQPKGAGRDLFIAPTSKGAVGELQVWWTSLEASIKPLEAGLSPDLSGSLD